jgi:hypothetical protein
MDRGAACRGPTLDGKRHALLSCIGLSLADLTGDGPIRRDGKPAASATDLAGNCCHTSWTGLLSRKPANVDAVAFSRTVDPTTGDFRRR